MWAAQAEASGAKRPRRKAAREPASVPKAPMQNATSICFNGCVREAPPALACDAPPAAMSPSATEKGKTDVLQRS